MKTEEAITAAVNDSLNRDLHGQAQDYVAYDRYNQPRCEMNTETVLDRAAGQLEGRFHIQPLVEAALRQTIGYNYFLIDESNPAQLDFQRAVELCRAHLRAKHNTHLLTDWSCSAAVCGSKKATTNQGM